MLKIEVLYPEICNLYGELSNIRYLKDCLTASGMAYSVVETGLKDEPLFVREKPDLVYMGTMTEKSQELVIEALRPYSEQLRERIQNDMLFLVTGNALEIFGHSIEREEEPPVSCLNLFNTVAKRKMFNRFNALYWGKFQTSESQLDVFGFKSQFSHSWVMEKEAGQLEYTALFNTQRGAGLNPEWPGEGFRCGRFMATYVIGPLLVLNPPFMQYLLKEMGVSEPRLAYDEAAWISYQERKAEFTDPDCGFYYH